MNAGTAISTEDLVHLHRVVGVYATRTAVQSTLDQLARFGQPPASMRLLAPGVAARTR